MAPYQLSIDRYGITLTPARSLDVLPSAGPVPQEEYYLWYDNGSGWCDCASKHATLAEAIAAAGRGWQPVGQRITRGARDVHEARVWEI